MSSARVALLGVKGGPAIRPGSNMPTSVLLQIAGRTILVDAGLGVTRAVCDQGVALDEIDLVLITHLHSDHYLELGPLFHTAWVAGRKRKLPVIGPRGLCDYWRHFCASMDFDISLRIEDEGRCDFTSLAELQVMNEGLVHTVGDLRIFAMRNLHPPIDDSFALKFEMPDRKIVLSGDTAYMPEMIDFSEGADLLVHECMLPEGVEALVARMPNGDERLKTHIMRSHTSAYDVGKLATRANVKCLAINHFVPDGDPEYPEQSFEAEVRKSWQGELVVGRDGRVIDI